MASTTSRWLIGGVVLVGILLLVSEHNSRTGGGINSTPDEVGGSGPCTVTVTADSLNVRSSPDGNAPVVQTFGKGALVSADRTIRNGFRSLGPDRWAAEEFLEPTPSSDCR
ncbi:MAG: SH3 domain-containing protein [Actinomycetota bacterium]|nr:SH3 domain-containing protein [Actinomycetota bacterium]